MPRQLFAPESSQHGRDGQPLLAEAYLRRKLGDRSENIQRAIDCYCKALGLLKPRTRPWAETQYQIARAYSESELVSG
jgi:hypothetical protein